MKTNSKKVLALALSAAMTVSVLSAVTLPASADTSVFDENNIKLRFPAVSDVHVSSIGDNGYTKMTAALDQLIAQAKKTDPNAELDALLVAGDLTNNGSQEQISAFAAAVKKKVDTDKTRLVIASGNHDYDMPDHGETYNTTNYLKNGFDNKIFQNAEADSDLDAGNYHTVVNGFHMIAVKCNQYLGGVNFLKSDLDWLKNALDIAVKADSSKPIFVTFHPMVKGTNLGSNYGAYWATTDDELYNLLSDYPQAISFSGHLHFPVHDDRTIWQGGWTTLGTGSVNYASLELEDEEGHTFYGISGSEPEDCQKVSNGLFVEVDGNNNTRITRMDFSNKATIKEPWVIPAPKADKSHLSVYSPEALRAGNTAPVFEDAAKVTAKKNADPSTPLFDVRFNAATDNDLVKHYEIAFYKVDSNNGQNIGEAVKTIYYYSDFYRKADPNDMAKRVTASFDKNSLYPFKLEPPYAYRVEVTAVDCFGMKSEPLKSEVYPGSGEERPEYVVSEDPHPENDYRTYASFNAFEEGYEMQLSTDFNGWPLPEHGTAAKHLPMEKNGYANSIALTYETNKDNNFWDVLFTQKKRNYEENFEDAEEFWIWVDLTDIQLSKMAFGFRQGSEYPSADKEFITSKFTNKENMFYYYENGDGTWSKAPFGEDGWIHDIGGYKGFIRFDAEYFHNGSYSMSPVELKAFTIEFTPVEGDAGGKKVVIDQIGFSSPEFEEPYCKVQDMLEGKTLPEHAIVDTVTYEEEVKESILDFDHTPFTEGMSLISLDGPAKDLIGNIDEKFEIAWKAAGYFDWTIVNKDAKYPVASQSNQMVKLENYAVEENDGKYVDINLIPGDENGEVRRSFLPENKVISSGSMDSGILFYIDTTEYEPTEISVHIYFNEGDYDADGNRAVDADNGELSTQRVIAPKAPYYFEDESGQFYVGGRGDNGNYISIPSGYKGYVKIPFGSMTTGNSSDVNGKVDLKDVQSISFNYGSYGSRLGAIYLDDFQFYSPVFDPNYVKTGDVDNDTEITVKDALLALQHSVGLKTLEGLQLTAADVNKDSQVDVVDALQILQYSVGLRKEFKTVA